MKANKRKRIHRDVLSHVISMVVLMTNIRERWVLGSDLKAVKSPDKAKICL